MKYLFSRVVIVFFFLILSFSPVSAKGLQAVVSHNVFYAPDPLNVGKMMPYVEFYWQADPRTVHYIHTAEKTIVGRLIADIVVSSDTGIIKKDHYIYETTPKNDASGLATLNIMDLKRYFIAYGKNKIELTIRDFNDTANHIFITDTFTLVPPQKKIFFSEIQLVDTIIDSDVPSPFRKNDKQKIPLCANFLDERTNTLHYYFELHGTDQIKDEYPLTLNVFIAKKSNELPYSLEYLRKDSLHPRVKYNQSGSFHIEGLVSGNYYVNATVENMVHKVIASQSCFFQRLNTHPKIDTAKKQKEAVADTGIENIKVLDLNKTFIARYDFGKVRAILKMMLPICDQLGVNTINGFLKNPDELYMRYFIYNYFAGRNAKDPGKAWREYSNQVIEVNKRFSFHNTLGYETDRGAIFLRYGEPTEIIPVENEKGSLPYEIWQYNTLTQLNNKEVANAVFLFYRPFEMTSDLKLLHSTLNTEMQNTGWRTYLYNNAANGTNSDSRAEQYIGNR